MPDWKQLICARMDFREAKVPCDEDTFTELADHLDELFDHWLNLGFSEAEAISRALNEVRDWRVFFLRIRHARSEEDRMKIRDKAIWVPGIVALVVTLSGLIGAFRNRVFPDGFYLTSDISLLIYVPWIGNELLAGFVAAYMSRRMGGQRTDARAISFFTLVSLIGLFFGKVLVDGVVAGPVRTWEMRGPLFVYVVGWFLRWVAAPSLVLFAGAVLFWTIAEYFSSKSNMQAE